MNKAIQQGGWKTEFVPLGRMHVNSRHAQREKISTARVDYLSRKFDLDKFGVLELSERNGEYYILDGQHRFEAIKRWLGDDWAEQKIECHVWFGLTAEQEAEMFLSLNDKLTIQPMDQFRVAVEAGRKDESHVNAVVEGAKLSVSKNSTPGAIGAVGTLMRVYRRCGRSGPLLARTLRIIRDSFGDLGFKAQVIDGIGLLCQRYDGMLDEKLVVDRLSKIGRGAQGLMEEAEVRRLSTGEAKAVCIAAVTVDRINAGLGPRSKKRIPKWSKKNGS